MEQIEDFPRENEPVNGSPAGQNPPSSEKPWAKAVGRPPDKPRIGRPPGTPAYNLAYDPKYCQHIVEYFEEAATAPVRDLDSVVIRETHTDRLGQKRVSQKLEVRRICAELPTLQGFAAEIGVCSQTLLAWAKRYPDFLSSYSRAKDIQFKILLDRGLTRQYDPNAFIFVAKNLTEMTDKQVIAGDAVNPLQMIMRSPNEMNEDELGDAIKWLESVVAAGGGAILAKANQIVEGTTE